MDESDSETPRRRTSRKAAENSKSKLSIMLKEDSKNSKGQIDMEDSDEDDWKPTAADKAEEKEELEDEKEEDPAYEEDDLEVEGKTEFGKSNMPNKPKDPFLGTETQVIPPGKSLRHGDFVVLKEDVEKADAHIWRYDCHGTMQRYNPIQSQSGNYLHKSANVFSGFIQADRDKFISIALKYVQADASTYTVKRIFKDGVVQKRGDFNSPVKQSNNNSEARDKIIKESTKLQEAFEVYLQALISHCLDTNFLDEVIADKDVYFLDNIDKVQSMTKSNLDKAMKGSKWPQRFTKAMTTLPVLNIKEVGSKNSKCIPCDAKYTSIEIKMTGTPYNQENLKPGDDASVSGMELEFLICSKCRTLVNIFNRAHHHKYQLFNTCMELINKRKEEHPEMESATILTELLANTAWLEEQFKKTQESWADADTYFRPS